MWFAKNHNGFFYLHILDRKEVEDGLYDSFQNTVDEGLDPVLEHNNVTVGEIRVFCPMGVLGVFI